MKIKFRPFTAEKTPLLKPIPAIKELPEWYKNLSPFTNGKKEEFYPDGTKNLTVKRCNPVGDALGLGYFLVLENGIAVKPDESGVPKLVWHRGGKDFITEHGQEQISPDLIPDGFSPQPFKFKNDWSIETPKGYSVLITHPLNRNAEPFLTLSGVVDTDSFRLSVQLPFLIRNDFEGVIEAGTPIAQVIPFKRESWQSELFEHSAEFHSQEVSGFHRGLFRQYKRLHWNRKEFK